MNTYKLSNVTLAELRKFLTDMGAKQVRTSGGHEIWTHRDLKRPIPLQSHIDPVPEFIVFQIIGYFGKTKEELWEMLGRNKGTTERKIKVARRGKRSNKNKKKK